MLIAVINQSTLIKNSDITLMCKAIQKQLTLHVFPAWNIKSGQIKFYSNPSKVPGYAWVINMLDNSTQAGTLGYHSEDNDVIDAFIFAEPVLSNSGVVLYDAKNPQNFSVSSVLSHEICEMVGDRFANAWCDNGDTSYALELCDPVEADSYAIDVSGTMVSVSNFIYPSWFNTQAKLPDNKPFDYLGKLNKPFTITKGGYMIYRTGGPGTEKQVFGEEMPVWKQELKKARMVSTLNYFLASRKG